jgi:hypothetical protein
MIIFLGKVSIINLYYIVEKVWILRLISIILRKLIKLKILIKLLIIWLKL